MYNLILSLYWGIYGIYKGNMVVTYTATQDNISV